MFAAPSHPAPVTDARKTFANTSGRPAKSALHLKHNLTGDISRAVELHDTTSHTADKKQQLAVMLEDNLVRRFGGTPAANALIRQPVTAALGSGARITPELMREMQEKIAQLLLKEPGVPAR
jgi:hypothetical protein